MPTLIEMVLAVQRAFQLGCKTLEGIPPELLRPVVEGAPKLESDNALQIASVMCAHAADPSPPVGPRPPLHLPV